MRGDLVVAEGYGRPETPEAPAEPVVSLRMSDDSEVVRPLRELRASHVAAAVPWRGTRGAQGQADYPGYYWCATSGTHVIYESRLELARLLMADFDRDVAAIAAQPFWLRARADGGLRGHVPDFFLIRADQSAVLVNVRPSGQLADPEVAAALDWPGRLVRAHGWDYEIWSGEDPVYLANLKFLAGYRRHWLIPTDVRDAMLTLFRPGDTFSVLCGRAGRDPHPTLVRAAVLRLLWEQRLITDLRRRLDGDSVLEAAGG
jgi:hypothetical protein